MSDSVFPALPGTAQDVTRETMFATTVLTTVAGNEQRVSWQTAPRYRYRVSITGRASANAPSPWGAYTEIGVIHKFFEDHKGSWDSFLWTDPYSASQVRVRFEEDTLQTTRVVSGWWRVEVVFVTPNVQYTALNPLEVGGELYE